MARNPAPAAAAPPSSEDTVADRRPFVPDREARPRGNSARIFTSFHASSVGILCLTIQAWEPDNSGARSPCFKAQKGRVAMQTSPPTASTSMPASGGEQARSRQVEDLVYQAVTVAAILMVLGSIWVF